MEQENLNSPMEMAIPIQNDPDSSKQDNDIDTAEIKDNCKGKTNFIVILPKIQNVILYGQQLLISNIIQQLLKAASKK